MVRYNDDFYIHTLLLPITLSLILFELILTFDPNPTLLKTGPNQNTVHPKTLSSVVDMVERSVER